MKIRPIINLCKEKKRLYLFEGKNEQWISDGYAAYPLFDLPHMDEKTICTTYDIDEKKAAKIIFRHDDALPATYNFSDFPDEGEEPAEEMYPYLMADGAWLIPYMTSQGVRFVDKKYLAPFSDTDANQLRLYERQTKDGDVYFAVKSGFLMVGLIMPFDVINDRFLERLKDLYYRCKSALEIKRSAEMMPHDDEQTHFGEEE